MSLEFFADLHAASVERHLALRIAVSQLSLPIDQGHIATLDEDMLHYSLYVQGISTRHHNVGGFADVE